MRFSIRCLKENSCDEFHMGIRSLARSPLYATGPLVLAYVGDTICHFIVEESVVWRGCEFNSHILSVTICENYAFVNNTDRTGVLLDVVNRKITATFDLSGISKYGIKSHIRVTSMVLMKAAQSMFIMLGTVSGHVFFTSFVASSTGVTVTSMRQVRVHYVC
ncbi:hypothetical protein GCK32_018101 [Trichostrongylus colubriformis]|uniref:Uncharacterized protein n=1 Tax=Trichostrongylus colubriformis TaxID=6319 RepID=A0AAN8FMP7_TRICO